MASEVGNLITELRESLGYSKSRLAREAGISHSYLVQIEAGDREPSPTILRSLAGALGVPFVVLEHAAGLLSDVDLASLSRPWTPEGMDEFAEQMKGSTEPPRDELARSRASGRMRMATVDADHAVAPTAQVISRPRIPPPEGWEHLSTNDRRLVQQMINRLRALMAEEAEKPEE